VQTSTNLFANGIVALLKNPDSFAELKNDLSLVATANEELLRYDPSLQFAARTATEDLAISGTAIAANDTVFLTIGAANRDLRRFSEPDHLNLRRKDNPHLSFGCGRHYCVGGALARIEAQEAMTLLVEMLPEMRLADNRQPFMQSGVALRRRPRLDIVF
jgi:cytochrome P450